MNNTIDIYNDVAKLVMILMPDMEVRIEKVIKNNGIERFGVVLRDSETNISPVIYLDDKIGAGWSVENLADFVKDVYEHSNATEIIDILDVIYDFDKVKKHLTVQLINKEHNFETLRAVPYKNFLDLVGVLAITFTLSDGGNSRILVNDRLIDIWNKDFETVYAVSMENLCQKPMKFFDLFDLVAGLDPSMEEIDDIFSQRDQMYVLTNANQEENYGAAHILRPELVNNLAEKLKSDLIFIPSSVHEWIILRDFGDFKSENLSWMIDSVNVEHLDPTEILSNHAYFWSRKGGWHF